MRERVVRNDLIVAHLSSKMRMLLNSVLQAAATLVTHREVLSQIWGSLYLRFVRKLSMSIWLVFMGRQLDQLTVTRAPPR